jgi:hypothetical protein
MKDFKIISILFMIWIKKFEGRKQRLISLKNSHPDLKIDPNYFTLEYKKFCFYVFCKRKKVSKNIPNEVISFVFELKNGSN